MELWEQVQKTALCPFCNGKTWGFQADMCTKHVLQFDKSMETQGEFLFSTGGKWARLKARKRG